MRIAETSFARRLLAAVLGIGIVGFLLFVSPTKSCKSTCSNETSYGPAIACGVVALITAGLLSKGYLRKRRNHGA